ncbi:MAG: YfhO family protein [Mariprofundaceae bacterium]|nr:YfhO family protein [Mariprofundaceae bacterium]
MIQRFLLMKAHQQLLLLAAAYTLFFALFFSPVWLSGKVLAPADAWLQSLPAYLAGWQFWTPYLLNGFPVASDPTTMSFYPLLVISQWLSLPWNLFLTSAYVIAAAGIHLWMFRLTHNHLASVVAGLTFTIGGFFLVHLQHVSMIHAAAWVPVMLYGVERIVQQEQREGALLLTLGIAMSILAGHPQITLYGGLVVMLYGLYAAMGLSSERRASAFFYGISAALCALLISAVFLFPVLELAAVSQRAKLDLEYFLSYSLNIRDIAYLFFPMLWGSHPESFYTFNYFGSEVPAGQGYTGALAMMLALAAWQYGKRRGLLLFWSVVAGGALILALGGNTPVGRWMFHLPGYNMFRVPSRNLFELVLAMAVLSGLGVAALAEMERAIRIQIVKRSIVVVLTLFMLVYAAILFSGNEIASAAMKWASIPGWHAGLSNFAISIPLLALVFSIAGLLWWAGNVEKGAILLIVLIAGISSYSWFENWRYDSKGEVPHQMPVAMASIKTDGYRMIGGKYFSDIKPPTTNNWPLAWGIRAADAYNPLLPKAYRELLEMPAHGSVGESVFAPLHRGLDLVGIRHLYADEEMASTLEKYPKRFALHEKGDVTYYRNRSALPLIRFAEKAVWMDEARALATIQSSTLPDGTHYEPENTVILIGEERQAAFAAGNAEVIDQHNDEKVIRTSSNAETLLVLADAYFPGWHAQIDGNEVEILRADYVCRGVIVPAGDHTLRFYYVPASFYKGLVISLLGFGLLGIFWRRVW